MKQKILAKLKAKYPALPPAFLGQLAEKLATKVTEETGIDEAVEALEDLPIPPAEMAKMQQAEGDRRVSDAEKKWKAKIAKTTGDDPDPEEDETDPKDPNAKLLKEFTKLQQQLETITKGQAQKSAKEKLEAKLKEKGIPVSLAKPISLSSDEEVEAKFTELEEAWNELKQDQTTQGLLGAHSRPAGSVVTGPADVKSAEADIKAWAEKQKKPEPAKA